MNSSAHHNPRSHLSLREVGTKAKNKSIASNAVTVTEVVKTTQVVSSSPKPNLLVGHAGPPDLNDSVFIRHQDRSLLHSRHLYASHSSIHYITENGLTVMPENLYGQGVGRRGRQRAVAPGQPGHAGPSEQATANGGEEALIEVEIQWEIYIVWLFYDYILLKIKMIEAATLFNFLFLVVILILM
ncbi:hypothetical protein Peur_019368 [Populus x canadensis]